MIWSLYEKYGAGTHTRQLFADTSHSYDTWYHTFDNLTKGILKKKTLLVTARQLLLFYYAGVEFLLQTVYIYVCNVNLLSHCFRQ